jgi:hypothetical protein
MAVKDGKVTFYTCAASTFIINAGGPTGLRTWFKGDTLPSSGAIASWTDSSGNGNTLIQGTGTMQPTVTQINFNSAALLDGINDGMTA